MQRCAISIIFFYFFAKLLMAHHLLFYFLFFLLFCIIYWDEHAESTICTVCGVTRYKKRKKAPRKVVWYFPITPRLQRYFTDPKVAKLLRWHADREEKKREDDGNDPEINKKGKMLSHPKDSSQW